MKIQATLKGYYEWVFLQLVRHDQEPPADVAKKIVDEWIREHQAYLKSIGITNERFRREVLGETTVVEFRDTKSDRSDGAG